MHSQSRIDFIISAAIKSWGGTITALSFFGTIISFFIIPASTQFSGRWVIILFFACVYIFIILGRAFIDAYEYSNVVLPKVKFARKPVGAFHTAKALLLVSPTPILSYDSLVSIYILESELERLIGIGKVVNIQLNKQIQIAVMMDIDFGSRWQTLYENQTDDLSKLIIKPTVPNYVVEDSNNG